MVPAPPMLLPLPQKPASSSVAHLLQAPEEILEDDNSNSSIIDGSYASVVFSGDFFAEKLDKVGDNVNMTMQQLRLSSRVEQLPSRDY